MIGVEQMLLAKFPPFDPGWSEPEMLAWFDAFLRLIDLLAAPAGRARPE